jgi:Na+/melibiose symporter-like transporter
MSMEILNTKDEGSSRVHSGSDLNHIFFLVAAGLFVTSVGQPGVIGQLPFLFLFKNEFRLDASEQANFFAIVTFAWYLKPLAGLLCDSFPLFGTRRRSYLLLSTMVAALTWTAFILAPHSYEIFFWLMVLLNGAIVIASTTIGGILVEASQKGHATGRLASVRYAIDGVISLFVGPLGGWLATRAFGWTAGLSACLMCCLLPIGILFVREPRTSGVRFEIWKSAALQLRILVRSKTMWAAAVLLFFVFMAPGFGIALRYYQQDYLNFDTVFIGRLQACSGIGGLLATALYATLCRRISLRPLLLAGILLNATGSLIYIWYGSKGSAILIDSANGFLAILGVLPLFDLAARATPKGSESFGYALLMSVYNIAVFAVSDPIGAWLYERKNTFWYHSLHHLVLLNSGASMVALILVPILPKVLLNQRDRG